MPKKIIWSIFYEHCNPKYRTKIAVLWRSRISYIKGTIHKIEQVMIVKHLQAVMYTFIYTLNSTKHLMLFPQRNCFYITLHWWILISKTIFNRSQGYQLKKCLTLLIVGAKLHLHSSLISIGLLTSLYKCRKQNKCSHVKLIIEVNEEISGSQY